jgi:chemotaxis protein methyltransferase CheR
MHKYFHREGDIYRVNAYLLSLVDFQNENIFSPSFCQREPYDIIFSRNLFIYFNESEKQKAIEIFCALLKKGGYLFFGHADTFRENGCITPEFSGRVRYYTKQG